MKCTKKRSKHCIMAIKTINVHDQIDQEYTLIWRGKDWAR